MESVITIAEAVRSGERSAVEIVTSCFKEIDAKNPRVNAFVYLDKPGALAAARLIDKQVEKGEDPGLLAGVPFGVKDLQHCSGMPSTYGSVFFKDAIPSEKDDEFVRRLRDAGAIPLGMVAAAEFGMDSATNTTLWGATRNPWNLACTPGGSSGGSSAAVASGMVPFCTAGDSAGSTRSPAAFTGTVGMLATQGRVPNEGGFDGYTGNGVITTCVRDWARLLDVMSGPYLGDRASLPEPVVNYESCADTFNVAGLSALWSDDYGYAVVEDEVISIARAAADKLIAAGHLNLVERDFSPSNAVRQWMVESLDRVITGLGVMGVWPDQSDQLSPGLVTLLKEFEGMETTREQVYQAHKALPGIEPVVAELFSHVDVLLSPTTACVAFGAEEPMPRTIAGKDASETRAEPFGFLANACWLPSISVPAGISDAGLPVGLQITCRRHSDELVLRLARILEQTQPWPLLAPGY
jgi:aspartyl-tRNA(Asn)/glutamyl-tRNA(Gln) amidotransferase subunit A